MSSLIDRLNALKPSASVVSDRELSLRSAYCRAIRGAAALEKDIPGSVAKLDRGKLDMSSPRWCALGQTYGEYIMAPDHLEEDAVNLGFDVSCESSERVSYAQLTEAWRDIIGVYAEFAKEKEEA